MDQNPILGARAIERRKQLYLLSLLHHHLPACASSPLVLGRSSRWKEKGNEDDLGSSSMGSLKSKTELSIFRMVKETEHIKNIQEGRGLAMERPQRLSF